MRWIRPDILILAYAVTACGPGIPPPGGDTGASASSTSSASGSMSVSAEASGSTLSTSVTAGPTTSGQPTTTATSTAADTTSDTSDSAGVTFIDIDTDVVCFQSGPGLNSSVCRCDVWLQDCPEDERCSAWANDGSDVWNAVRCSPVDPDPAGVGEPCTVEGNAVSGLDSCDRGSICWNVDPDTLMGTCVARCEESEDNPSCPDSTACMIANDGVLNLCLSPCNPLVPTCEANEACRFLPEAEFFCLPTSQGGQVEVPALACDGTTICDADETCLPAAVIANCTGDECCSPWCDTNDPTANETCTTLHPELECVHFFAPGQAPSDFETLGVCAIPG